MLDQHLLAGLVAVVHRLQLRAGDVALVHDQQPVVGEIINQALGGVPLLGRPDGGRSSPPRCNSPPDPASPGRTWCAAPAAGPPAACLRLSTSSRSAAPNGWH